MKLEPLERVQLESDLIAALGITALLVFIIGALSAAFIGDIAATICFVIGGIFGVAFLVCVIWTLWASVFKLMRKGVGVE